jgi:hypothetical protein
VSFRTTLEHATWALKQINKEIFMKTSRAFYTSLVLVGLTSLGSPAGATQISTVISGAQGVWDTSTSSSAYQNYYTGWEHLATGTDLILFPLQLFPSGYTIPTTVPSGNSNNVWVGVQGYVPSGNSMNVVLLTTTYNGLSYNQTSNANCGTGNIMKCGNWNGSGLGLGNGGGAVAYITLGGDGTILIDVLAYST